MRVWPTRTCSSARTGRGDFGSEGRGDQSARARSVVAEAPSPWTHLALAGFGSFSGGSRVPTRHRDQSLFRAGPQRVRDVPGGGGPRRRRDDPKSRALRRPTRIGLSSHEPGLVPVVFTQGRGGVQQFRRTLQLDRITWGAPLGSGAALAKYASMTRRLPSSRGRSHCPRQPPGDRTSGTRIRSQRAKAKARRACKS